MVIPWYWDLILAIMATTKVVLKVESALGYEEKLNLVSVSYQMILKSYAQLSFSLLKFLNVRSFSFFECVYLQDVPLVVSSYLMAPQMPPVEINMTSNTIGRSSRGADYNKEALHQIRASLQPYAHGGPRERLSPSFSPVACQSAYGLFSSEEEFQRAFNGYSKQPILSVENPKIIRKSSFERELTIARGSPALDSNISTRSDSPGVLYSCALPHESSVHCTGHQYAYGCAPEPSPPPPPPRSQGLIAPPPPTPPRGTTPPPLYSTSATAAATMVNSVGQRPLILSRLSPGPAKTKSSANYVNISSVSQTSSQRGTSPVSHICRQPLVVQNCAQVQQHLNHQMQSLSLNTNSGHTYSTQGDRPPPYPIAPSNKTNALY
ncbi:hypothetical protein Anas_09659 [Armadillidium nasatum]|uniref:Uncharacterized protein n=1 Tax=Armadillidium nasatum TaxID=96803 RepID=A0A5N5SRP5_9CRUS|nr:hypothetical protein Anas_09659 [Armadillidium nasatum]